MRDLSKSNPDSLRSDEFAFCVFCLQSSAEGISVDLFIENNPECRDYVSMVQTMSQESYQSGQSSQEATGSGEIQHTPCTSTFKSLQDLIGYLLDMNVPDRFLDSCQDTFKDLPLTSMDDPDVSGLDQPMRELDWDRMMETGPNAAKVGAFSQRQPECKELQTEAEAVCKDSKAADFVPNSTPSAAEDEPEQKRMSVSEHCAEKPCTKVNGVPESAAVEALPRMVSQRSQDSIRTLTNSNQNLWTNIGPNRKANESSESLKTLTTSNQHLFSVNRSVSYYTATTDFTVLPDCVPDEGDADSSVPNGLPQDDITSLRRELECYVFSYRHPPPYVRPPPVEDDQNSSDGSSVSDKRLSGDRPLSRGRPPPYVGPPAIPARSPSKPCAKINHVPGSKTHLSNGHHAQIQSISSNCQQHAKDRVKSIFGSSPESPFDIDPEPFVLGETRWPRSFKQACNGETSDESLQRTLTLVQCVDLGQNSPSPVKAASVQQNSSVEHTVCSEPCAERPLLSEAIPPRKRPAPLERTFSVEHPCLPEDASSPERSPQVNGHASPEVLSDIPTDEESFRPDVLTHVRLPAPERPGSLCLDGEGGRERRGSLSGSSTTSSRILQAYGNASLSPSETLV